MRKEQPVLHGDRMIGKNIVGDNSENRKRT